MNNYFSSPNGTNLYEELAKLQQVTPIQSYRTTFTDIAKEWSDCSTEEQNFINNDEEYVKANLEYQQGFNSFLLEIMGAQFLSSQYGKTAENVLISLKHARDRYSKHTNENIKSIQEQNEMLKSEIEELKRRLGESSDKRKANLV